MASEQRTRKSASPMPAFLLILKVLGGLISLCFVLRLCDLRFRAWVGVLFCVVLVFLVVHWSFYLFRKFSFSGIIPVLLVIAALGRYILFFGALYFQPEHVIEKHGQKMVAQVNGFLDVNVFYYEYKNFLVCGYEKIGSEWYGSGSFDPFHHPENPQPISYIFFDPQGNLIASSEDNHDFLSRNGDN